MFWGFSPAAAVSEDSRLSVPVSPNRSQPTIPPQRLKGNPQGVIATQAAVTELCWPAPQGSGREIDLDEIEDYLTSGHWYVPPEPRSKHSEPANEGQDKSQMRS